MVRAKLMKSIKVFYSEIKRVHYFTFLSVAVE